MLDMDKIKSLIAFVGMRDPYPEKDEEPGPILSLLLDKLNRPGFAGDLNLCED